jgi:hypothetical protein
MPQRWTPLAIVTAAALAGACGDGPTPPPQPLRTVLIHQQVTGINLLLDTDGEPAGLLDGTTGMLPLGANAAETEVALLDGSALVLVTQLAPSQPDTILQPVPTSMSLVSFSEDGDLLALVSYAPDPGVIVYDRVNGTLDTLSFGPADPALPPIFSPDNTRIALLSVTDLSLLVTVLRRDGSSSPTTEAFRFSRVVNLPMFGWPRWLDDGLHMAFRRAASAGPDTVLVGLLQPDDANSLMVERYRAVLAPQDTAPGLELASSSTYALAADGAALVLGAMPAADPGRHAIYLVTADIDRVRVLVDDPERYLVFPLFVRE